MKTSSTILVAVVAATLGAYGYSLLAPAKVAHTEHAADKKPEKPSGDAGSTTGGGTETPGEDEK